MEILLGVLIGVFLSHAFGFLWEWARERRFRMTTRSLLIVMTLVSVALAAIVIAAR